MTFKESENIIRDKINKKENHKNHEAISTSKNDKLSKYTSLGQFQFEDGIKHGNENEKYTFNKFIKSKLNLKNSEKEKGFIFKEEVNKDELLIDINLSSKNKNMNSENKDKLNNEIPVSKMKHSKSKKTMDCINKIQESQGIKFFTKYHHPGKWMFIIQEQMECWSCCLNENKDSEGCLKEKGVKVIIK